MAGLLIPGVGLVNQGNGRLVPGDGITQARADAVTHSASGVLAAQAATSTASASRIRIHSSSGVLSASSAAAAGTAQRRASHSSSGVIVAGSASLSGVALRRTVHYSFGAVTAGYAVIDCAALRYSIHTSAGSLYSEAASIAASAELKGNTYRATLRRSSFVRVNSDRPFIRLSA